MSIALPFDAHAHIDTDIASHDLTALRAFVFAMTRSLDEFEGLSRNDSRVIWALGVHPGLVRAQRAFDSTRFRRLMQRTPVIGEAGLDGASRVPMDTQLATFREILAAASETPRIVSIHSYRAEAQVLRELNRTPIHGTILHWWTGSRGLTEEAVRLGCYFSIPPGAGALGIDFFEQLPPDRILTETDHPSGDRRGPMPRRPGNVGEVERNLRKAWSLDASGVRNQIRHNLAQLVSETGTKDLFGVEWRSYLKASG